MHCCATGRIGYKCMLCCSNFWRSSDTCRDYDPGMRTVTAPDDELSG